MTNDIMDRINSMTKIANPTVADITNIMNEWEDYFCDMDISEKRQTEEFDGIMRARVQSGVISIRAPQLRATGAGCN